MKTIQINGDSFSMPNKWHELNKSQLLYIASLSLQTLSVAEFKVLASLRLLGLTVEPHEEASVKEGIAFYVRHKKKTYLIDSYDIHYISQLAGFIFKEVEIKKEIHYQVFSKLFTQLIPEIHVSGHTFLGPESGLTNVLFKEYIRAETFFSEFLSKNDKSKADSLIATLYRPKDENYNPEALDCSGDPREPLNDYLIDKRAKIISKLDDDIRQAILLWYEGCKFFLTQKYPYVFEEGETTSKKETASAFEGFMRLVATLSNNDATRSEAWLETNLHMVLLSMDNMRKQQIELEEKYKK